MHCSLSAASRKPLYSFTLPAHPTYCTARDTSQNVMLEGSQPSTIVKKQRFPWTRTGTGQTLPLASCSTSDMQSKSVHAVELVRLPELWNLLHFANERTGNSTYSVMGPFHRIATSESCSSLASPSDRGWKSGLSLSQSSGLFGDHSGAPDPLKASGTKTSGSCRHHRPISSSTEYVFRQSGHQCIMAAQWSPRH